MAHYKIGDKSPSGWEVIDYEDVRFYKFKAQAILETNYFENSFGYKKGDEITIYWDAFINTVRFYPDKINVVKLLKHEYKIIKNTNGTI